MGNYVDIENVSANMAHKVKQDLKFKTGNFLWRVKFNTPLDPRTVNNVNLYVTDSTQSPLKTAIRYDTLTNTIEIEPLEPYTKNESYILNVTTSVKSKGGNPLKEPIKLQFKVN